MPSRPLPLALTMGEPAGIGPDLILQIFSARQSVDIPRFVVFGHAEFLARRASRLGLNIDISIVDADGDHEAFDTALPVVSLPGEVEDTPGVVQAKAAPVVVAAITQAVGGVQRGAFRGLVTAPINKAALYASGFAYPGHTEFLAALAADEGPVPHPVMMLTHEDLRVVPLTIHIPLAEVPQAIDEALIRRTVSVVDADLRKRFAIDRPRIAVAGLNPHAGEQATIGREEVDIILPAIERLRHEGFDLIGPLPGDTLFYPAHWRQYDCVIAMYHDQALIPIKTVAFDSGVNATLGLPFVRTSPDHGTALSLAGTGKASANSLLAALRLADMIA